LSYVERFSVSLDAELLAAFDHYLAGRGYTNRSEAVRDLIRDQLLAEARPSDASPAAGGLAFVVDRRSADVGPRLREILAGGDGLVAGVFSQTLDADRDFATVFLKGPLDDLRRLAGRIEALRGVTHARLHLLAGSGKDAAAAWGTPTAQAE
jgi:CopG family nickel-responsive transcriptional regulator